MKDGPDVVKELLKIQNDKGTPVFDEIDKEILFEESRKELEDIAISFRSSKDVKSDSSLMRDVLIQQSVDAKWTSLCREARLRDSFLFIIVFLVHEYNVFLIKS